MERRRRTTRSNQIVEFGMRSDYLSYIRLLTVSRSTAKNGSLTGGSSLPRAGGSNLNVHVHLNT
jgi:hypothetical protein